jgi:hypothetical protein
MAARLVPTQFVRVRVLGGTPSFMRVVRGIRLAFQAERCRFDACSPLQVLSLCNVNLVDGLIWSQEAVGSNPTMETNLNATLADVVIAAD